MAEHIEHIEQWRRVPGYEDRYAVSDFGRIYSLRRQLILKPWANYGGEGYEIVQFGGKPNPSGAKHVRRLVHRVVLEAFAGPCPFGLIGMHGPGGSLDNRIVNLKWGAESDNHRQRYGSLPAAFWADWYPRPASVILTDPPMSDLERPPILGHFDFWG